MPKPILRHIANLWTLMGHPTAGAEWSLDEKLRAIKAAGFDGVCWAGSPELQEGCRRHDLMFVGGMSSGDKAEFPQLLADLKRYGAMHINVQLADHDTSTDQALKATLALMEEGDRLGVLPAVETHRDTCTETPEKTYALVDGFAQRTGRLLRMSLDFSHFAVVKHLTPDRFAERLLTRPDLVQYAQQFHLRPFNGHHCQVPVTDGRGTLTQELRDWMPFAQALLRCWLKTNRETDREIFLCPEMGPVVGGYNLSTLPNAWEEAKVLRREIDALWRRLVE